MRTIALPAAALVLVVIAGARQDLSEQELKLLQDPGGWEYAKVSDQDGGIQTQHTCFDGTAHPDECSGRLIFTPNGTFIQNVYIHHQQVSRHGSYRLNGAQIAFFDEFGTQDGPYTVSIDVAKKTMSLSMPQVQIDLVLESTYKKALNQRRGTHPA
jgi:hypothetical protein